MPERVWAGVRHDLTRALEDLADQEFLVLGEHAPRTPPRQGLLSRWTRTGPPPTRYVQALRVADVFSAECVGPRSQGGTWEMDGPTVEQLQALGWLTPAEARTAYACATPNFAQYVEVTAAPPLADLMVASLAVLGASPSGLVLEVPGSGLRAVGD